MAIEIVTKNAETPDPTYNGTVVDQNVLQDKEIISNLIVRARTLDEPVVLPDIAIAELLKTDRPDWKFFLHKDLRLLAEYPGGVRVAHSLHELMREELNESRRFDQLIHDEVTRRVQLLLCDLRQSPDGSGPQVQQLCKRVESVREVVNAQHLKHDENRAELLDVVNTWLKILPSDVLTTMKRESSNPDKFLPLAQREMSSPAAAELCVDLMVSSGMNLETAQHLACMPSAWSHWVLAKAWLGLRWAVFGGAENMAASELTNEFVDMHYWVTASFCRGFAAKDKRVKQAYSNFRRVVELRWYYLPPIGAIL